MSNSQPPDPIPAAPAGWYSQPGSGKQRWWTGSQWLDSKPKSARTAPLAVLVVVGIAAFVVGLMAGLGGGSGFSRQSAADERIKQLEAQLAEGGTPSATGQSPAPATPEPQAEDVPVVAATLSGGGNMNSEKISLKGNYGISWTTLGSCYYSATLIRDGRRGESAFTASDALSGTGNVYGLEAGDYHLDVITGPAPNCGWSVTFTPTS